MLDVGQLEVHLREPHQDAVPRRLKLLPLTNEVLFNQRGFVLKEEPFDPNETSKKQSYLQSAQDGGYPFLQVIPSPVPIMHHFFEAASRVRPVLPGQTAVLLVDEFQLGQILLHLALEGLCPNSFSFIKNKTPKKAFFLMN